MKKRYLPLGAMTVVAIGLAACSGSDDESGGADTLEVWIMEGTNPDSEEFFDEVAATFEDDTGATLEVEFVQWDDAHDRFVTSIAGGTTPDVAETGTTWTPEFADAGALQPIGDRVKDAGLDDDLVEGLVEAGTYEDELYGMPWYAGVRSLIYRSDIFDELGLEAPTTWDEIVEVGEAIAEAEPDMIPFAVPGDAEFGVYPWVWGAGGEVSEEIDGEWVSGMDSPEAQEGISFFTGLATEHGFSSSGATTWNETDVLDNFVQENVAMALQGSWTPEAIVEDNPDLEGKFAAAVIPGKDGGIAPSVLGGSHLSVFETASDPDLAFEFVKLMTTGEFAEEWGEASGYFPGQTSLLEAAMESDDPLVEPFAEQMVDGGGSVPVAPNFGAVQAKETTNSMMQAILSEQKTVEQATEEAAAEMDEVMNGED